MENKIFNTMNLRKVFLTLQVFLLSAMALWAQPCATKFDYYKNAKTVVFVNKSEWHIGINTFYWNFGDGSPVLNNGDYQLSHNYTQAGKYRVCLVDSLCTGNAMYCDSILVSNTKQVNAKFGIVDLGNGNYFFSDSSTTSGSPIVTYQWDFGDGVTSNEILVKHNYHATGQYIVSLTILDSNNNFDIYHDTLNVTVNTPCFADFDFEYIDNQFQFKNLSTSPDTNVNFTWVFGDNSNASNLINPIHKYAAAGNYEVKLYMFGPSCGDTIQKTINQPDTALCNISFNSLVNYQKVLFTVTSSNTEPLFEKYLIDFGDLNQDYMESNTTSHIYSDTGSYKVCVYSYVNLCGVQLVSCKTIRIDSLTAICKANFDIYSSAFSAVAYNASIAYGSSVPSNITLKWGDGFIYSGIDSGMFNHTYSNEGSYNVTLIMNNPAGCIDSITKIVSVGPEYVLRGTIKQGGLPAFYSGVYVYSYDSVSGLLYKNNYTSTDENGNYSISLKKGYYLVQADFAFDPINNGFYLPTYYKNKLNWDLADVIYIASNRDSVDIDLIPFNYDSAGNGTISGFVKYGTGVVDQNGPVEVGKPADKMLVYLIDDKGKAISYTHTDTDGKFDFGKVPVGNYKVWGEMAGKQTIPALANINNIVNKVSGINIIIGKNTVSTSINQQPKVKETTTFNVYPNPTNGIVKIDWTNSNQKPNSVQIFDITGKLLVTKNIEANDLNAELNIAEYTNGLYLVKIISKDGNTVVKKVFKQD